jgi:hypothetical protein
MNRDGMTLCAAASTFACSGRSHSWELPVHPRMRKYQVATDTSAAGPRTDWASTPLRKYRVSLLTTALHCGYPDASVPGR